MKECYNFKQIFEDNNWDAFKICRSFIITILQLNSQQQNQLSEQQNNELQEQIKKLKELKEQKFKDILEQLEKYIKQVQGEEDTEEEMICLQLKESLEFHMCIASHGYDYSVVSLIDIAFGRKTDEKQVQLQKLLKKSILSYFQNKDYQNIKYHKSLLANAYHNIQKEEYANAKILLDELSKYYNQDKLKESNSEEEKNRLLGLIESIHTYQALSYLYSNKLDDLEIQIRNLQELTNFVDNQINRERIQNHIDLFYIHLYFIKQDLVSSQKHLKNVGQNLQSSLLLFFLNQNSSLLSHMETIYYNLFGNELFQVFKELQEFEIINKKLDIKKIKKLFQEFKNQITNKSYSYGKGLILILSVIYTILLRLGGNNDEAIKHNNLIFQICKQTSTDFQKFLDLFFRYNRVISYLQKIKNDKNKQDQILRIYQYSNKFHETNLNILYEYQNQDGKYIFKKQKTNNNQVSDINRFQQLNEACIQMLVSHPNIQNIEDIFADTESNIVVVQKMQGKNLKEHLDNKNIDQEKAMSYIQQILTSFCYLHSVNIIHSDFKLQNVVTFLDDETQIKIIDFGFSQIKIFNKFFTPLGKTKQYAPKEKIYTFESDIYSIGESIAQIFKDQHFYKSKQMQQLIDLMKESELKDRCTINEAQQKFQLEMFIYKIFVQIISKQENISILQNQNKQQIYENFADSVNFLFQKFRRYHYNTFSVQKELEQEKKQFTKFQEQQQMFNIAAIVQSIKFFIQHIDDTKNLSFFKCLTDKDIKLFFYKFLSYDQKCSQNQRDFNKYLLLEQIFTGIDCQEKEVIIPSTNYEENKDVESLINKLIGDNSRETNQLIEEIEKELSEIKYSEGLVKLSHTQEYKKLISNIEAEINNLENNNPSFNNQNIIQSRNQERINPSNLNQINNQQESQAVQLISQGSYINSQSQQYSLGSSYNIQVYESSANQSYYYSSIQNKYDSVATSCTQSGSQQDQSLSEKQDYCSFLSNQSNQQPINQSEQ
ncbi:hypothetical protein ABPG74_001245 [Tetrahymena malaccensis]